jgi:hypothetical protein
MIWRGRNEDYPPAEPPPGESPPNPAGIEDPGTVGGRIESIIDAAERAAAGIGEDAEERARRYYEDSKRRADEMAAHRAREMSDLTDNLMQRARQVAQQSDQLITALEDAGRRMIGGTPGFGSTQAPPQPEVAPPPAPPPQAAPPPASNDQPPAASSPPPPPPAPPVQQAPPPAQRAPAAAPQNAGPVSEGARLLATQMAIAGSSRDEISRRLRDEFGVLDPTAILNEIGA